MRNPGQQRGTRTQPRERWERGSGLLPRDACSSMLTNSLKPLLLAKRKRGGKKKYQQYFNLKNFRKYFNFKSINSTLTYVKVQLQLNLVKHKQEKVKFP